MASLLGTATHAGQLRINILEARQLVGKGGMKIDPYCVLSIKHGSGGALAALIGTKIKSQVIKNNTNPYWNETHYMNVKDPQLDLLNIKIKDKSLLKSALIGSVDIPIRDLVNGTGRDLWVDLIPAAAGKLHLMVQYTPAGHQPFSNTATVGQGMTSHVPSAQPVGAFTTQPQGQFSEKTTTATYTTESYIPRP